MQILPTDVTFTMSRDAGEGCLCSRCLLPIISEAPVKVIPTNIKNLPNGNYEFRYHQKCLKPLNKGGWGESYKNLPY
jgi:hypothetical protein